MTAENFHLTIDTGIVVTQNQLDPLINTDAQFRTQSLPAHIQLHSTHHTHFRHQQQVSHQGRTHLDPECTNPHGRSTSPYRADIHGHGRRHSRGRNERRVSPSPDRQPHEVSANALAQKLKELKTGEKAVPVTKSMTDKNQDPEKTPPPLLLDRTALISLELQQRGEEVLQDILKNLESKKGALILTELAEKNEAEDSTPDSSEIVRQHTHKLNPELLKDNHPLQQHHGDANLRHH
ncbi:hypothetical protein EC957_002720 [Mortierella hygrophila]|uniref:Uncharacterized protein n=1 Tax=Mortierella hygrophila TaxID=979708 RepID=A0A9P6K1D4_9FUNG|nr:hypothetical protein EC957_002720 [Mortierella hygrophila]